VGRQSGEAVGRAILLAGQHFGLGQALGAALLLVAIVGHEALAIRAAATSK